MRAHARCENAKISVFLGFCIARADNRWTCDAWAPSCRAAHSVVRVFFGGGVIGVCSTEALRARVALRLERAFLRSPPSARLRLRLSSRGPHPARLPMLHSS